MVPVESLENFYWLPQFKIWANDHILEAATRYIWKPSVPRYGKSVLLLVVSSCHKQTKFLDWAAALGTNVRIFGK